MNNFKYGDSVFVGFKDDKLIRNTQNYPRMYKAVKDLKRWMPEYDDTVAIVEYVPKIKAKWEQVSDGTCYWYQCSNCDCETPYNKWGHLAFSRSCPDCGAEMEYFDLEIGEY